MIKKLQRSYHSCSDSSEEYFFITPHKLDGVAYKHCNVFYNPASIGPQVSLVDEHSYQVQIGSKFVPEYPIPSVTESYMQLKKTVGKAFKMHSNWYRSRKYIIGLGLGKISGACFLGMGTKSGDLLILNFRDCDQNGSGDSVPSRVFCALNYDCVLNVSALYFDCVLDRIV